MEYIMFNVSLFQNWKDIKVKNSNILLISFSSGSLYHTLLFTFKCPNMVAGVPTQPNFEVEAWKVEFLREVQFSSHMGMTLWRERK